MNFLEWRGICAIAALAGLGFISKPEAVPSAEVVADLLETFDPTLAREVLSCEIRRPATASGVKKSALFEHPLAVDKEARVEYKLTLPANESGDRLLLAFELALSDGIDFNKPGIVVDGVRFAVEVDGERLFEQEWKEIRWQAFAIDLNPFAGRSIKLTLIVEAIGTTNFDWALWGIPRVLRFRGAQRQTPERVLTTTGAIAIEYRAGKNLKLRLVPASGGKPIEWREPGQRLIGEENRWVALDFDFPQAEAVDIQCEPKEMLREIHLAPYPAKPRLVRVIVPHAVVFTGEPVPLRVEVKNEGRGRLAAGVARVELQAENSSLQSQTVTALAPGETWTGEWPWQAPARAGRLSLTAHLQSKGSSENGSAIHELEIFSHEPSEDVVENEQLRIELVGRGRGYSYARVLARQSSEWIQVGILKPLMRAVLDSRHGDLDWEIPLRATKQVAETSNKDRILILQAAAGTRDPDGVAWEASLKITLEPNQPVARLSYEWTAQGERRVKALWGPNLYVGEGTTGAAKTWGLFPGLEYLYGAEQSSNPRDFAPPLDDRRTPHPNKITVPLMAITIGPDSQPLPMDPARFFTPDSLKDLTNSKSPVAQPASRLPRSDLTIGLTWDPLQKWDGQHAFPSTRFSSPNLDEGMNNHRIGLFLPSVPEFVPENSERAHKPYLLTAQKKVSLSANLVVTQGSVATALREWYRETGGIPKPGPWPRTFEEELKICRAGFLKTVWDEKNEKWRHCIGWDSSHAPGFATLLWMDARVTTDAEGSRQSRDRVELAARNMQRDGGPGVFTTPANCHILRWEFPFLFGCLPEAMPEIEGTIKGLIASQHSDGSWRYRPANDQQTNLGQADDSVLGTCSLHAAALLRYARITGDAAALEAGERSLHFMERFRVPRGGQTWECPMYEPDILAAAWAVAAYLDGYRITGNPRWLHDAVYWAETGLPFTYQWTLPERPMMMGATIPVFGSTFYTHSWLAMPVQWCGLVYAYHVHHLAEELAGNKLPETESPLPIAVGLTAQDWKRVAELITVSAMHQQFSSGPRIGTYPDSISDFQKQNPAFINPEDILLNVLTLKDHDPDIKTVRLPAGQKSVVISSGARIDQAEITPGGARFRLRFFKSEPSHSLITGIHPRAVTVDGKSLPQSDTPVRRAAGWWWDEKRNRAYLVVAHENETVEVQLENSPGRKE
ncbi:MAG: CARDB domain-containing protein [Verrucomicrobiota bacterium]